MDSLAIFIFIWAVLALFFVWLCKFLYNKYMVKDKPSTSNSRQTSVAPGASIICGVKSEKLRLSEPREILASKTDLKDLAKSAGSGASRGRTPLGSGIVSSGGSGVGGPTMRRRMVRQSSTGPENRKKRYVPPPSNVVGPETTSVTWTSQAFRWLYSDLVIINELLITWVIALNDSLRKSVEEHGIAVEVVRVLPESPAPGLNNIFCNCDEYNPADMVISFDCDAMPVLQVKTFRQKSGKVDTSHYKVTVSRLRGRLATTMNYNSLKGEMRFEGYPDIRVGMNSVGAIKPMDQDEQQLQELIAEIMSNAIRETVYPVDFSLYSTCPRGEVESQDLTHNMEHLNASLNQQQQQQQMISGRRLLVKIVKGEGLRDAVDPYVVVEMDEPAQKNQTGTRKGSTPYWDEHFLFDLAANSAEILFEVYDRPAKANDQPKFLGLGLVGIDELAVGPASTQMLALQPRPYETQPVSGALTVDFVFIEGAEIPAGPRPYKLKEALRLSTPAINEHLKNGADLADAAVRALQDGALATNGQPSKSTLIIHSVQRNQSNPNAFKVEMNKEGKIEIKESPSEKMQKEEDEILSVALTNAIEKPYNKLSDSLPNAPQPTETSLISTQVTTTAQGQLINEDIIQPQDHQEEQIEKSQTVTELTASPTDSYPPFGLDESSVTTGNASGLDNSASEFGRPNAASSPNGHNSGYSIHNNYGSLSGGVNATTSSGYNSNSLTRNGVLSSTTNGGGLDGVDSQLDGDRGRSKKRNFFGTLKKRLSRSKTRTHSADHGTLETTQQNNNNSTTSSPKGTLNGDSRSLSVDRAVMSKSNSLGPRIGGLQPLQPLQPGLNHSRRSSISESSAISGFSSASSKTYIHEASTLVLETIENGIKRHFIVPLAIAQRPRWRRKGTKLHIYNDHTFIAKHLSGSGLQCAICMKSIPRRPGKQGYECRDCQLICHKQCHIRAPQACPNPTVLSMELSKLNSAAADRSIRKL